MRFPTRCLILAAALLTGVGLPAAERIPPAPAQYFNDYAGIVSAPTAEALNRQLEQYERDSSNQLLVAIYPKMESDSSVEDYTVRVAQAWHAGQKGKDNGAVLFAFMQEHQLYIQVGYGLEATLTDALASQIIRNEIRPAFRAGNYDGGLTAAVQAMIAATKGEYQGTGRTNDESGTSGSQGNGAVTLLVIALFGVLCVANIFRRIRNPSVFMNPGRRSSGIWWGGGGSGGGWSGGGGGGGGFSGGGGGFGGGGAGGSW